MTAPVGGDFGVASSFGSSVTSAQILNVFDKVIKHSRAGKWIHVEARINEVPPHPVAHHVLGQGHRNDIRNKLCGLAMGCGVLPWRPFGLDNPRCAQVAIPDSLRSCL